MRLRYFATALALLVAFVLWTSDKITLEGERTIYSVSCQGGSWAGKHCSGHLVAGERYRFRALKPHREVVFWTVGASEPSGKFGDCDITNGRNWACRPSADAAHTITLRMAGGLPVPDDTGHARAFHAIAKWRWFLLRLGAPVGRDADV
jgi:hypothetical protein